MNSVFVVYAANNAPYRPILKDVSGCPIRESRKIMFFENIFPMKLSVRSGLLCCIFFDYYAS